MHRIRDDILCLVAVLKVGTMDFRSRLCQKNLKRRIDDDWRQESGSVKLPPFSKSGGSVELEIVT